MTNKTHHGSDAELIAVSHGVYHHLISQVSGQLPSKSGNLLSRTAIGPGFFVSLTKSFDGRLVWAAVTGPLAEIIGMKFGLELFHKHRGHNSTRKVEVVDHRDSSNN